MNQSSSSLKKGGGHGHLQCGFAQATVLFQKTQRLPSASLGSDVKQIDDLKPGEQPMVSKKPNVAWHRGRDGRGWKGSETGFG